MIRVFLLALLALGALVLVATRLPYQAPAPRAAHEISEEAEGSGEAGPFARWDGIWEGTLTTRRPDGTIVETAQVRQESTTISPAEQKINVMDRGAGRGAVISRHVHREVGDHLECEVTDPNGLRKILRGNLSGPVIFWHRRDPSTRGEESYREEVLRLPGGDLYTLDGFRVDAKGESLIYEGRYRRVENTPR